MDLDGLINRYIMGFCQNVSLYPNINDGRRPINQFHIWSSITSMLNDEWTNVKNLQFESENEHHYTPKCILNYFCTEFTSCDGSNTNFVDMNVRRLICQRLLLLI